MTIKQKARKLLQRQEQHCERVIDEGLDQISIMEVTGQMCKHLEDRRTVTYDKAAPLELSKEQT